MVWSRPQVDMPRRTLSNGQSSRGIATPAAFTIGFSAAISFSWWGEMWESDQRFFYRPVLTLAAWVFDIRRCCFDHDLKSLQVRQLLSCLFCLCAVYCMPSTGGSVSDFFCWYDADGSDILKSGSRKMRRTVFWRRRIINRAPSRLGATLLW